MFFLLNFIRFILTFNTFEVKSELMFHSSIPFSKHRGVKGSYLSRQPIEAERILLSEHLGIWYPNHVSGYNFCFLFSVFGFLPRTNKRPVSFQPGFVFCTLLFLSYHQTKENSVQASADGLVLTILKAMIDPNIRIYLDFICDFIL